MRKVKVRNDPSGISINPNIWTNLAVHGTPD